MRKNVISRLLAIDKNHENSREVNSIYQLWTCNHKIPYIEKISTIGLLSMCFLIATDKMDFGQYASIILNYRLALIAMFAISYGVVHFGKPNDALILSSLLVLPLIGINLVYIYLLATPFGRHNPHLFWATIIIQWVSTYVIQSFWKEQVFQTSIVFVSILSAHYKLTLDKTNTVQLCIWILSCGFIAFIDRRAFTTNLLEKYRLLRALAPEAVARFVTVAASNNSIEEAFPPKNRYFACICADWRGFQELTMKHSPKVVSKALEYFHEAVFEELPRIVKDQAYFHEWTADQFFIIIYSASDDFDKVKDHTLEFIRFLATELPRKLEGFDKFAFKYDVGATVGVGLLGLQGPKMMKKTTCAASIAGEATRLETEAKEYRREIFEKTGKQSEFPYVFVDSELHQHALQLTHYSLKFDRTFAKTKDIVNKIVFRTHYEEIGGENDAKSSNVVLIKKAS